MIRRNAAIKAFGMALGGLALAGTLAEGPTTEAARKRATCSLPYRTEEDFVGPSPEQPQRCYNRDDVAYGWGADESGAFYAYVALTACNGAGATFTGDALEVRRNGKVCLTRRFDGVVGGGEE